jgi:hypothetical protein
VLPWLLLSSGGGANIKYIIIDMAGTPNINDQRKELRHLQKKILKK